jgi:predicted metal-dependent peptidase
VFEFIDTQMTLPRVLLYFTDLDGKFPMSEPHYEVLWIVPKVGDIPFGRVIEMNLTLI